MRSRLMLLAAVALGAAFLAPMLQVGFVGDDVSASYLRGALDAQHTTVWHGIVVNVSGWLQHEGRFYPIGYLYGTPYFALFSGDMVLEKAVQLAFVVLNLWTFGILISRLAGARVGTVAVLAAVATLQIRFWYDPIVGFFILLPLLLQTTFLALLWWRRALESRDTRWAVAAVGAQLFGMLTYEMAYGLALAQAYLIARYAPTPRWRIGGLSAVLGSVIIFSLADVVLRHTAHQAAGSPYAIHAGGRYGIAVALELLAALPATYALFHPIASSVPPLNLLIAHASTHAYAITLAALVLSLVAVCRAAPRDEVVSRKNDLTDVAILGLILWIVPAAIISLSARWQTEITPGLGYLNVYIEYFGVAMIGTAGLAAALRFIGPRAPFILRTLSVAVAVALAVVIFVTERANAFSYSAFKPLYTDGRINFDRASRGGLFDPVPTGSMVIVDSSYAFAIPFSRYLIFQDAGKSVDVGDDSLFSNGTLCLDPTAIGRSCTAKPNVWKYRSGSAETNPAWVQLAHVTRIGREHGVVTPYADRVFIFTNGDLEQRARALGATMVRSSAQGDLYRYRDCLTVDGATPLAAEMPHGSFGVGFSGPEQDIGGDFRWGSSRSTLRLINASDRSATAQLVGTALALGRATVRIATDGRVAIVHTDQRGTPFDVPVVLRAASQQTVIFETNSAVTHVKGDPRTLAVRLNSMHLADISCRTGPAVRSR